MKTKFVHCPECGGAGLLGVHGEDFDSTKQCSYCKGTGAIEVPMSNADRIRAMSDEELARFLCNFRDNHGEGCSCNNCVAAEYCGTGHNGMIDWLHQPAKEEK